MVLSRRFPVSAEQRWRSSIGEAPGCTHPEAFACRCLRGAQPDGTGPKLRRARRAAYFRERPKSASYRSAVASQETTRRNSDVAKTPRAMPRPRANHTRRNTAGPDVLWKEITDRLKRETKELANALFAGFSPAKLEQFVETLDLVIGRLERLISEASAWLATKLAAALVLMRLRRSGRHAFFLFTGPVRFRWLGKSGRNLLTTPAFNRRGGQLGFHFLQRPAFGAPSKDRTANS